MGVVEEDRGREGRRGRREKGERRGEIRGEKGEERKGCRLAYRPVKNCVFTCLYSIHFI